MEWKTPEHLFRCTAKFEPEHGKRLKKLYESGKTLSAEMDALRRDHLAYVYELGEKGILFAGGSLDGFWGNLSIFAVNSEEEARKAKRNDPYYIKGYVCDDQYAEWFIHQPIEKASPKHKKALEEGLREAGVEISPRKIETEIPERLFICFSKRDEEHTRRLAAIYDGKGDAPMPPEVQKIRYAHLKYGYEMGVKGLVWAAGHGMSIFAVNSIEEARKVKEGDPYHKAGFWIDYRYHEWIVRMPYSKLSAPQRERMKPDLIRYGIIKA